MVVKKGLSEGFMLTASLGEPLIRDLIIYNAKNMPKYALFLKIFIKRYLCI